MKILLLPSISVIWNRTNTRVTLRNKLVRSSISIGADDYLFVSCFDSERTVEEALDHYTNTTGVIKNKSDVLELIERLINSGILKKIEDELPTKIPSLAAYKSAKSIKLPSRWKSSINVKRQPSKHVGAIESPPAIPSNSSEDARTDVAPEEMPIEREEINAEAPDKSISDPDKSTSKLVNDIPNHESSESGDSYHHRKNRVYEDDENLIIGDPLENRWRPTTADRDLFQRGSNDRRKELLEFIQRRANARGQDWGGPQRGQGEPKKNGQPLRKRRIHLIDLPVTWILPLAGNFARILEGRVSLGIFCAALLFVVYGLWSNRSALLDDVSNILLSWEVMQRLILILVTVDLFQSLIRAGAIWRASGILPRLSLTIRFVLMHALPWLSFHTDLSILKQIPDRQSRSRIIGATILAHSFLIMASAIIWMAGRSASSPFTFYALEVLLLAFVYLFISLNPFGKSDLYHLVSLRLGARNLRGLAFQSLFGKSQQLKSGKFPLWALRTYALASILFILFATYVLVYYFGRWLTENYGGVGALYLLVILFLLFAEPASQVFKALLRKNKTRAEYVPENALSSSKRITWSRRAIYLALAGLISVIPYEYETSGQFELLPQAKSEIHAQIEGDIREVLVKEGDWVNAGQTLVRLGNEEQVRNVEETAHKLVELDAKLLKAKKGATPEQVAVSKQAVEVAKTRYDFSRRQAERYSGLLKEKFISEQSYENMVSQAENDRQSLELAQRSLEELLAGTRSEDILALQAQLDQARAQLTYYRHQYDITAVRATISGRIVSGTLMYAVGDHLKPEDAILVIEDGNSLLVQISVPETDITLLPDVAEVRLRTWSMPETSFKGKIQRVAPSAEQGDIGRVVRVLMEFDNTKHKLPTALTGYAKISCGDMPLIMAFTRMFARFFMVEVWSWLP